MLRRCLAVVASAIALLSCALTVPAQSRPGFLPVSSSNLLDAQGNKVASATVCGQVVNSTGQPLSVRVGPGGITTLPRTCVQATNGAWTMYLPDTSVTSPANACISITAKDNTSGQSLIGPGYTCVQPTSVANGWCTGTACSFDSLPPQLANLPINYVNGTGGSVSLNDTLLQSQTTALLRSQVLSTALYDIPTAGLMADYQIVGDPVSTTLKDYSGNGRDGTFESSAPSRTTYGLMFTPGNQNAGSVTPQYVDLPTSVSGWKTAYIDFIPAAGAQLGVLGNVSPAWNLAETLLSSSLWSLSTGADTYEGGFQPEIFRFSDGIVTLQSAAGVGGHHVLAVVCNSSGTSLYLDGAETAYAQRVDQCPGSGSNPGPFYLGGSKTNASNLAYQGAINRVVLKSSVDSAAMIAATSAIIAQGVRVRPGFPSLPAVVPGSSTSGGKYINVIFVGDSEMRGYGAGGTTIPGIYGALSYPSSFVNVNTWAISGMTAQTMARLQAERHLSSYDPNAWMNIFVFWAGTNDLCNISHSAPKTWSDLVALGNGAHAMGSNVRTLVATVMSRNGCEGQRVAFNQFPRQFAVSSGAFDGVLDLGGTKELGPTNAYSNGTYFISDGIHLTTAGQTIVANIVDRKIQWLLGSSATAPSVLGDANYSLTPGQRYMITGIGSTDKTYSLYDCNGLPGQQITISVNGTGSLNVAAAVSGQSVVNSPTISGGSAGVFQVFNAFGGGDTPTTVTGACVWNRVQ